jgi:acyl carrier protein
VHLALGTKRPPFESPATPSGPVPRQHESEVERAIAGIFAEALGMPGLGADDNVLELGIHSLMLVSITQRLRTVLGTPVPAALVFEHPTPRALAAAVRREA